MNDFPVIVDLRFAHRMILKSPGGGGGGGKHCKSVERDECAK